MAVTVYFKNGQHATIALATKVQVELVGQSDGDAGQNGIGCYDDQGNRLAQFFQSEIVGYQILELPHGLKDAARALVFRGQFE